MADTAVRWLALLAVGMCCSPLAAAACRWQALFAAGGRSSPLTGADGRWRALLVAVGGGQWHFSFKLKLNLTSYQ